MASKSNIFKITFVFLHDFRNIEKHNAKSLIFKVGEGLARSNCDKISIQFGSILDSHTSYASRGLEIASKLLQVGLHEPMRTELGSKLAPSCIRLGPCWPQLGSNLAQARLMLGAFLGPQPPLGQPKPFRTPSQDLPDPFPCIKEAMPRPPGLGCRIWSLRRLL